MARLFPLALASTMAAGCGAQTTDVPPAGDNTQPIEIAPSCADGYPADPFTLQSASVEDDVLALRMSFAGGCEPHDFFVCWRDGSFQETAPVRARLAVFHDGHGDMCEAYLTEERHVDLTRLREAYQRQYGESGTMIIDIGVGAGIDGGAEHSVEYTF